MLSLFRRHLFATFGAGSHRLAFLRLLGQQFGHHDLGDPVDFLDGLLLDRHQIGIGEIGDPAAFDKTFDDEVSDFFGGRLVRCRFHGKYPSKSHPKFLAFPATYTKV